MSSLFHSWRNFDSALLKLPAVCVPGGETDTLRAKREAQLKWMRERGVRYLGNPMVWPDRRARGSAIAPNRNPRAPFEGLDDRAARRRDRSRLGQRSGHRCNQRLGQ